MFILFIGVISKIAEDGVVFKDDAETILQDTPPNLVQYEIKSKVTAILGGTASKGAFYSCKNSLKSITFESNSSLEIVEPFAFASLRIKAIDMSSCSKLKVLEYSCFRGCTEMTSIILPPNLEIIQSGSFYTCGIKKISFPDTLTIIQGFLSGHSSSFAYCSSLSEVKWGEKPSISSIGSDVFNNCNLTSFRIPITLKDIGVAAFMGNPITNFIIDSEEIYSSEGGILFDSTKTVILFYPKIPGNYSVKEGVKTLYISSFRHTLCAEVFLSKTVTSIGTQCFLHSSIVRITIPSSITQISQSGLSYCAELKEVIFEGSLSAINNRLFQESVKLESIKIPRGVQTIYKYAFQGCAAITEIWIPNTVNKIEESVFQGINDKCNIIFESGSTFVESNRIIYSSNKDRIITYIGSETTFKVEVEDSVTVIGGSAFYQTGISSISFHKPSNCKYIESSAFFGCTNLKEVEIPNSVIQISDSAFKQSELNKITFEEGSVLKIIGAECFKQTKITDIDVPKSVEELHMQCFQLCSSLFSAILYEGSLTYIGESCFESSGLSSIQIPSSANNISDYSFRRSQLFSVTFNNGWKGSLPMEIFKDCVNLSSVTLSNGVSSIGRSSFEGCISLPRLSLPTTVKTIEMGAFRDCKLLNSIFIPEQSILSEIESLAFFGCERLTTMNVSDKNQNFLTENGVLYNKDKSRLILFLPGKTETEFISPRGVIYVDAYAFQNADHLELISFNDTNLKEIGYASFESCSSLRSIVLPATLTKISPNAFDGCPFGCGSIIHPISLRQFLIDSKIDIESLTPCATLAFTKAFPGTAFIEVAVPVMFEGVNNCDNFYCALCPYYSYTYSDQYFYIVTLGGSYKYSKMKYYNGTYSFQKHNILHLYIILINVSNNFGRSASSNCVGRYFFCNNRTGSNNSVVSNYSTRANNNTCTKPHIFTDFNWRTI